ncbi:MAG: hypothetical protein M9886_02900 [Candidatus Nanopelagicales bacterium]|nr:hypothetical protein [Candidatus Nanopelagicales bacterium]
MSVITLDNGKTSIQVNGLLVATGITRAGLSVREVARRCGVTFNIIYRITRDDEYSADLPIRHLAQLAQLLDLTLPDLLNQDPLPSERPEAPEPDLSGDTDTIDDDARRLAAVLALSKYLGGPDTIAQGLGWTLDRLYAARHRLNERLAPLGIKATNLNDHIYLTTTVRELRAERERDIQRIEVLETRERPWSKTLARILDNALNNRHPNVHREGDKPALGYAVNVGYLAPDHENQRDLGVTNAFRDAFPDL